MAITTPPTYEEFIIRFPSLSDVPQENVQYQLDFAVKLLSDVAWDSFFNDAVGLETAHNLFLMKQACSSAQGAMQATAGPVSSVGAAGVSIGFQGATWNDKSKSQNWYMKTIYGQQLLRLWETCISSGYMAC
jgi:hypothetical protein